ncbi:MAG: hypothetical protein K6D94_10525 [Clostridiales bacterium]|nr:hypothetical protein [Clostridiales bacterium]
MNIRQKTAVGAFALSIAVTAAVAVFADGYNTQADPLVTVSYVQSVKQDLRSEFGIDGINSRISELSSSIIALEQTQARQAQELQQIKLGANSGTSKKGDKTSEADKKAEENKESSPEGENAETDGDAAAQTDTAAQGSSEAQSAPAVQTAPASASAEYEVVHLISGQILTADSSLELIPRSGELAAVITSETNRAAGVGLSDLTSGSEVLDGEILDSNHYILIPRADGRGVAATGEEAYLMVRGEYTIVG